MVKADFGFDIHQDWHKNVYNANEYAFKIME